MFGSRNFVVSVVNVVEFKKTVLAFFLLGISLIAFPLAGYSDGGFINAASAINVNQDASITGGGVLAESMVVIEITAPDQQSTSLSVMSNTEGGFTANYNIPVSGQYQISLLGATGEAVATTSMLATD